MGKSYHYKKVLLLCWFDHFLDSRAESCQIFRWFLGKSMTPKSHSEINWPLRITNVNYNFGWWLVTFFHFSVCSLRSRESSWSDWNIISESMSCHLFCKSCMYHHITQNSLNLFTTIAIKVNPKKFISTHVPGIKCMGGTCKCKQYFCNLHNSFFHKL